MDGPAWSDRVALAASFRRHGNLLTFDTQPVMSRRSCFDIRFGSRGNSSLHGLSEGGSNIGVRTGKRNTHASPTDCIGYLIQVSLPRGETENRSTWRAWCSLVPEATTENGIETHRRTSRHTLRPSATVTCLLPSREANTWVSGSGTADERAR